MFQLWKLVLLCSLLTGTSASLLEELSEDLKNVIDKGRDTFGDSADAIVKRLKDDIDKFQDSKIGQLSEQALQKADELFAKAVSKVLSFKDKLLGLKIHNTHFLGIKPTVNPDGKSLNLTLPIGADVELSLPFIDKRVDLNVSVDLLSGVRIETQDGKSKVVLTECTSNPDSVSLTLVDNQSKLANTLVRSATSLVSDTLSILVEKQVCPLVRLFVASMSVEFLQNAIDKLQKEQKSGPSE
ncbi:BPI fold-containing family A member 2 [Pteronotus mesoamericanus]|uniref:BPI fold-containing family A member 2 n=1 Tax=Pteronotus mesoamericanus TaxID=1884717 RepID=UPI0023ECF465|nr:BPI fold-containing family A member 2 [Pteronotus parnellii mesoamericanus]